MKIRFRIIVHVVATSHIYVRYSCALCRKEECDRDGMIKGILLIWVGDKTYSEENVQRNSQKDIVSQA